VGAVTAVALASRFWGLGCPKIFHEVATHLSYGLARDLGGDLRAENLPRGGVVFTLTLPLEQTGREGGEE
ncbi:MAG: hypothetical protein AB2812_14800, partial [Candidatus Sedimenticola endophacoides]